MNFDFDKALADRFVGLAQDSPSSTTDDVGAT
jgi:hypothetical protein